MKPSSNTFRQAGLACKTVKSDTGATIFHVRDPNSTIKARREQWWPVTGYMFDEMKRYGPLKGFHTYFHGLIFIQEHEDTPLEVITPSDEKQGKR